MSAKHFWVKTVYALFFIVLLIATVLFALNVKHDTPAFGDDYDLISVEYTVVANDLNLPSETEYDSFQKYYYSSEDVVEINAFKAAMSDDPVQSFLNSYPLSGQRVLAVTALVTIERKVSEQEIYTETFNIEPVVYSKNEKTYDTSKPYAVLQSANVSGTAFDGTVYDSINIYSVSKPGYYRFDGVIVVGVFLGDLTNYFDGFTVTGATDVKNANVKCSSFDTSAESGVGVPGHVLFYGDIQIDANQIDSYGENFGISAQNRTYGEADDFRDVVSLHSDTMPVGGENFVFSTKLTDYNVSNSDLRFFKTITAFWINAIPGQTDNKEPGLSSDLTNLTGLADYLELNWYIVTPNEYGDNGEILSYAYELIPQTTAVTNAGTYALRIESKQKLEHDMSALRVSLNGEVFEKFFVVEKRELYLDLQNATGFNTNYSKEYDGNTDATVLFSNKVINPSDWTNYMNGLETDYDNLLQYIEEKSLFVFSGSVFTESSMGDKKSVNLHIAFYAINDMINERDAYFSSRNYIPVVGQGEGYGDPSSYVFNPFTSDTEGQFLLSGLFTITANQLSVRFSQGTSADGGKPAFVNTYEYGEKERITAFDFNEYLVVAGATERGGVLSPIVQPNWKIVIQNNTLSVSQDSQYNTLYLVLRSGRKIEEGSEAVTGYVDSEGTEYSFYEGRFFAKEYFFLYDVYVVYSNEITSAKLTVDTGVCSVKDKSGTEVLQVNLGVPQNIIINPKTVTVTIESLVKEKVYDGTNVLKDFYATAEGLLPSDTSLVEFQATASYAYAGAGEEVPLNISYAIVKKEGAIGADELFADYINSYRIDEDIIKNNTGYTDNLEIGTIYKRELNISFVEVNYEREYNQTMYVAVRVGRAGVDVGPDGLLLTEDYYYYYVANEDGDLGSHGYRSQSFIEANFYNNVPYVKLEISGFLEGEGFVWNPTYYPVSDFTLNKAFANPDEYYSEVLRAFNLLSWVDTSDPSSPVDINKYTTSSQSENDRYRLEINNNYSLPNYTLNFDGEYAYLFINKLDVDSDDIKINENVYIEYTSEENASLLYTNGTIDIGNHKEYAELSKDYPDFTVFLNIESFVSACTEPGHEHNFADSDILGMVIAGTYYIELAIPTTTNYNSYTISMVIEIKPKYVDVYVTFPFRVYGDEELIYDDFRYIDNIEDHTVIANSDGEIVADEEEGNKVYVYNKDLSTGNLVLYSGFISGEEFGQESTDTQATVAINLPDGVDAAGSHIDAVVPSGATKHNYTFRYHAETLYVKRKPLTLEAADYQQKNYTGNDVMPDYKVTGGPGLLAMYVIGYGPLGGEIVMDEVEDETKTSVVEAGQYVLKAYAKPDASQGASSSNYDVSDERLTLHFTVIRTQLELIEGMDTDSVIYSGKPYELHPFNAYFSGIVSGGTISTMLDWGTVEIVSVTKDGENFTGDIIDTGTYILGVHSQITNTANVYFGGESETDYEFNVTLEVLKSDNFVFNPSPSQDIFYNSSGNYYYQTYNGKEAAFGYSLTVAGEDYSDGRIGVVTAYDGVLYAVNQNAYNVGDPVYNEDAALAISAKLPEVNYNISVRPVMLNVGSWTVTYYVNHVSDENYNANYVSKVYTYSFNIDKKQLIVNIAFEEGFGPYKVYGESNESVEEHVYYEYTGWIGNDGENEEILAEIVDPFIDWSDVGVNSGKYAIRSVGGTAPGNYYFDHSFSDIDFQIKKAESWIIVYGFIDDNGEYTDYRTYNGLDQEPSVLRVTGSPSNPVEIDTSFEIAHVYITFAGVFIGEDKENITEADIGDADRCKDVGGYVFAISVEASVNFNAVPEKYYYFEITKAELDMYFVSSISGTSVSKGQGYASKVYDKTENYPEYAVVYEGFLGEDDEIAYYKNVFYIRHINTFVSGQTEEVEGLGLIHPYYVIKDSLNQIILPYNVGQYSVSTVFSDEYGISRNYNVNVRYGTVGEDTVYPVLEITKRPLDVIPGDKVEKIYDGKTTIPEGLIQSNNYIFTKTKDAQGNEIELSGPVEGDVINIVFDLGLSRFERKDVHDEFGEASDVYIRIYGSDVDSGNYKLDISDLETDENGEFFRIIGRILPATADIRFFDEQGNALINIMVVEYDGQPHSVVPVVTGVRISGNTYEEPEYVMNFLCETIHYDSELPPTNAETYIVTLTINSPNYNPTSKKIDLRIDKATVDIVFGGDAVQTYGSIINALTAIAYGVGNYSQLLNVSYYDGNGILIPDITKADAGVYKAVAIHEETQNFKYSEREETFTVKRRDVHLINNILSSYDYNGKAFVADVYFEYQGNVYYPTMSFDKKVGGEYVPYNYGETPLGSGYPSGAGEYRAVANNDMRNFNLLDNYATLFTINKVNATVSVKDLTKVVGETINFDFSCTGAVAGESISAVLTSLPSVRYFDATTGKEIDGIPTESGIYKVLPYEATSDNYILSYDFGILTLNKPLVQQSTPSNSFGVGGEVIVEGSFGSDVSLVVRAADTLEYSQYNTILDIYKLDNAEFASYEIAGLYYLRMSDGSVQMNGGGTMTVKIYAKTFLDNSAVENGVYYVARINSDGSVTMLEGRRDGDYIVVDTDKLEAFAILTDSVVLTSDKNYDWVLYVGIAVGVLMIGAALLIVKLRA